MHSWLALTLTLILTLSLRRSHHMIETRSIRIAKGLPEWQTYHFSQPTLQFPSLHWRVVQIARSVTKANRAKAKANALAQLQNRLIWIRETVIVCITSIVFTDWTLATKPQSNLNPSQTLLPDGYHQCHHNLLLIHLFMFLFIICFTSYISQCLSNDINIGFNKISLAFSGIMIAIVANCLLS